MTTAVNLRISRCFPWLWSQALKVSKAKKSMLNAFFFFLRSRIYRCVRANLELNSGPNICLQKAWEGTYSFHQRKTSSSLLILIDLVSFPILLNTRVHFGNQGLDHSTILAHYILWLYVEMTGELMNVDPDTKDPVPYPFWTGERLVKFSSRRI